VVFHDTIETQIIEEFDDSLVIGRDWAISPLLRISYSGRHPAHSGTRGLPMNVFSRSSRRYSSHSGESLVEHSCIDTECTIITHIDRSQDTEISLGVAKVTNPKHVAHSEQRN